MGGYSDGCVLSSEGQNSMLLPKIVTSGNELIPETDTWTTYLNSVVEAQIIRSPLTNKLHRYLNPCQWHQEFPSSLPSKHRPCSSLPNFSVQMETIVSNMSLPQVFLTHLCVLEAFLLWMRQQGDGGSHSSLISKVTTMHLSLRSRLLLPFDLRPSWYWAS